VIIERIYGTGVSNFLLQTWQAVERGEPALLIRDGVTAKWLSVSDIRNGHKNALDSKYKKFVNAECLNNYVREVEDKNLAIPLAVVGKTLKYLGDVRIDFADVDRANDSLKELRRGGPATSKLRLSEREDHEDKDYYSRDNVKKMLWRLHPSVFNVIAGKMPLSDVGDPDKDGVAFVVSKLFGCHQSSGNLYYNLQAIFRLLPPSYGQNAFIMNYVGLCRKKVICDAIKLRLGDESSVALGNREMFSKLVDGAAGIFFHTRGNIRPSKSDLIHKYAIMEGMQITKENVKKVVKEALDFVFKGLTIEDFPQDSHYKSISYAASFGSVGMRSGRVLESLLNPDFRDRIVAEYCEALETKKNI